MTKIIERLKKELGRLAKDPAVCKNYSRFYKDHGPHFSIAGSVLKKVYSKYFKEIKDLDKKEIFELCDNLLSSKIIGARGVAFDWAFQLKNKYEPKDFKVFKSWLKKYVDSWDSCDDLCTHALGYFLYQFPQFTQENQKWAKSKNLWLRRAAAVSLIYSVRNKKKLDLIFKISDILLKDKEDLAQKGYGWTLKEASNIFQKEVFDFVMERKEKMPRMALRYAVEKLPANLKKKAMK